MCLIRAKNSRIHARISKLIRRKLKLTGTPYPIIAIDGFSPPQLKGSRYHASTLRIEVGKGWIISKGLI